MSCKGKDLFLPGKEKCHLFILFAANFDFFGKKESKSKNILYFCSRIQNIENKKSNNKKDMANLQQSTFEDEKAPDASRTRGLKSSFYSFMKKQPMLEHGCL